MWLLILIVIVIIVVAFLCNKNSRRKLNIIRWRKALSLNKHAAVFEQLYADVDGFSLSRQERTVSDSPEYVYGEIIFEPFIALLSLCQPNPSTVFYDLGSGTGKAVLACSMVFNVKKSCGIELFPGLHNAATSQQQRLMLKTEYQENGSCIEFKNNDFLQVELTDASLVFINATAFLGEVWLAISKHLEQLKPGALVISTSKPLRSKQFLTIHKTKVAMTWGIVSAFIQQRQTINHP
ncbi:Histone methylation protein DOT1 [Legionella massiliensis]|uniref:Histone-lysine N-methyltransferase, H3 lysine-79 specific n=1 Tax=Legionella massiliensis TaxID=1034943 RepID=A0A078KNV1_9GAMM|nr:hypothetical protein [Legionella massiliensis]CDZ76045.1 Histone methylation protein DOT1 [Legionella massiliensis]CEE11783.1 Histone methylation protein DOT1 [Legionella massiliensis]